MAVIIVIRETIVEDISIFSFYISLLYFYSFIKKSLII
nr:MAG TPA: hypothetical protein [Caudoviricetes sp.]